MIAGGPLRDEYNVFGPGEGPQWSVYRVFAPKDSFIEKGEDLINTIRHKYPELDKKDVYPIWQKKKEIENEKQKEGITFVVRTSPITEKLLERSY